MLPFLVGEITVSRADGTSVHIGSGSPDPSDEDHDGDGSSTKSTHASTPSKHRSNSGDSDGTVVPIVAIVFVFLWLIIKALMAPFTQKANRRSQSPTGTAEGLSEEEQAVLLKLQRTIGDMERRIESLETILIDEQRTKEKYGTKI